MYSPNNYIEYVCFLIEQNKFELVKYMISSNIVNLNNVSHDEYNFFDIAYIHKRFDIMCYLYSLKININNTNGKSTCKTLLEFACVNNDLEFVKYLTQQEKNKNEIIASFENLNNTNCLIWTISLDNLEIFKFFVQAICIEKFKNYIETIKKISTNSNSPNILNYLNTFV